MSTLSTNLEDALQCATHQARLTPILDVAFVTGRGGRDENQDCCGYARTADGAWIFCVADGLGGHSGGRVAAQAAVQGVLKLVSREDFSFDHLDRLGLPEVGLVHNQMAALGAVAVDERGNVASRPRDTASCPQLVTVDYDPKGRCPDKHHAYR